MAWQAAVAASPLTLVPTPWQSVLAIVELAEKGLLVRYMVASLFRVTWGYLGALLDRRPRRRAPRDSGAAASWP